MTTTTKPRASRSKKAAEPVAEVANEDKALVVLPADNLLAVFKAADGIKPYIEQIRAATVDLVFDMNIKKERDALRALAANIARSKTYMEESGKELTAEYKKLPAMIDATRRYMRDELDALRDQVRQPLTDWEAAEAAKALIITNKLEAIGALAHGLADLSADQLRERLEQARAVVIDDSFGDKQLHAAAAKDASIASLEAILPLRQKEEDDRAELQRLRQEKLEREQREETARAAAALAQKQIDDANARTRALEEENARLRQAATAPVVEQRQDESRYESRHQAEPASSYYRTEEEPSQPQAHDEQPDQQNNVVPDMATVNRNVLKAIVGLGASPELAKAIVVAIVRGKIANVSINY